MPDENPPEILDEFHLPSSTDDLADFVKERRGIGARPAGFHARHQVQDVPPQHLVLGGEQVTWYLAKSGSSYQVVDMSVLGVRLSIAMRDAFGKELKKSKGDFNALYDFLAKAETW